MFLYHSFRVKVISEFTAYLDSLQSKEEKKCHPLFLCEWDNSALIVI